MSQNTYGVIAAIIEDEFVKTTTGDHFKAAENSIQKYFPDTTIYQIVDAIAEGEFHHFEPSEELTQESQDEAHKIVKLYVENMRETFKSSTNMTLLGINISDEYDDTSGMESPQQDGYFAVPLHDAFTRTPEAEKLGNNLVFNLWATFG